MNYVKIVLSSLQRLHICRTRMARPVPANEQNVFKEEMATIREDAIVEALVR